MLITDVGPGIHQLEHAHTNLYLVEVDDRVVLVDTGLPTVWPRLLHALRTLGKRPADVECAILTHAHFDHVGCARRIIDEWDVRIWVPTEEAALARRPYRYKHERSRLGYPVRYPASVPILWDMTVAGAWGVHGVDRMTLFRPTSRLPGGATVIPTPGHTKGHVALHFPERDVLIAGDALVTLDPYTGESGPQIVAGAATANSRRALESLRPMYNTHASLVLPGHGSVWRDGIESAVTAAAERGAH